MKKNKKRLLISILVLFVVWCGVLAYIIISDNNNQEDKGALGIENITTLDNINVKIGNDFYVRDEGEKLVVYDFNNNFISEYTDEYTSYEIFDKRLIIVTNKNNKKIINKNSHEMVAGSHVKYSQDNKYILVDNAVYDYNLRKVYVLDFTGDFEYSAEFANDLLIINSYQKNSKSVIIDLSEKKELWSNFSNSASYRDGEKTTYLRFMKNKKGYLLNTKTKQIEYEDITYKEESYMDYNIFTYKDNIIYIDNGVSYVQSANNTYTFTGLDKGTYNIKAYVQDSNGKNSEIISKTIEITSITLADYVKSLYTGTQGNNGIYYHDANLTNGANDNSYRYAGANPNNYVCFGSTETSCPTDNLYRIIGVFGDKVKLIKYDYANSNLLRENGEYSRDTYSKSKFSTYKGELTTINRYYWNLSTQTNTWSESSLNKVNLNKNFINNIRSEWASKIDTTTWKVGGNTWANIGTSVPATAYQNEIVNPVTTNTTDSKTEYKAKVGLMYVSDYGFAAAPSAWTLVGWDSDSTKDYRTATSINWMYMGLDEWLISRNADGSGSAFLVDNYGRVGYGSVSGDNYGVRPSFNLSSSITYVSGSGTSSDPIRIN